MTTPPTHAPGGRTRTGMRGFTLIELMFVVLVISILMVIAIPAYQNYVARAQVSEGLSLADGLKSTIGEICITDGTCTGANSPDSGLPVASTVSGRYVESVNVVNGTATVTYGTQASSRIANLHIYLAPRTQDGALDWRCSSDIDNIYLPSICKSN